VTVNIWNSFCWYLVCCMVPTCISAAHLVFLTYTQRHYMSKAYGETMRCRVCWDKVCYELRRTAYSYWRIKTMKYVVWLWMKTQVMRVIINKKISVWKEKVCTDRMRNLTEELVCGVEQMISFWYPCLCSSCIFTTCSWWDSPVIDVKQPSTSYFWRWGIFW
jgi:hypothetical protein